MLRCFVAKTRPLVSAQCSRGIRELPEYNHPGDPDPVADRKFDEEFGIKEPEVIEKVDKFWFIAPITDGWWRTKLRLFSFFGDNLPYRQSEDEIQDRQILTDRLHQFYETIPQSYPDEQWWNDCIDHYVKYNDYDGAQKMYLWLGEQRIDVDDEILEKFNRFFYENDPVGLYEKGIVQQLRSNQEHLPDRNPDAVWRKDRESGA